MTKNITITIAICCTLVILDSGVDHRDTVLSRDGRPGSRVYRGHPQGELVLVAVLVGVVRTSHSIHRGGAPARTVCGRAGRVVNPAVGEGEVTIVFVGVPVAAVSPGLVVTGAVSGGGTPAVVSLSADHVRHSAVGHRHAVLSCHSRLAAVGRG